MPAALSGVEPQRAGLRRAPHAASSRGRSRPERSSACTRSPPSSGCPAAPCITRSRGSSPRGCSPCAHGAATSSRRSPRGRSPRDTTSASHSSSSRRSARSVASTPGELEHFAELLDATEAAISHEEWDAANAAFHEYPDRPRGQCAALALLPRAVREPDDAGDPRRARRGPREPRHRAPPHRRGASRPESSRARSARSASTSRPGRRIALDAIERAGGEL